MTNNIQRSVLYIQEKDRREEIEIIRSIRDGLGIPDLFARILVSRGIASPEEAESFLYPVLDDLSDPFLMPDIQKGAERLITAIIKREDICLYGDYDADGITSTALIVNYLKYFESRPEIVIPKREDGYGLNIDAVKKISAKGIKLLICVDCGSSDVDEIDLANSLGLDVVVIDHHELPQKLPKAYALINPKRKDSRFPEKELAACGVTFFFLWALRRIMHNNGLLKVKINLKRELDIVALGTMADMVPLTGDNRILVKFGMDVMRKSPRLWLKSLIANKVIPKRGIDENTLNFVIIPRINATGRVSDPKISLDYLTCKDEAKTDHLLKELNDANTKRRRFGEETLKEIVDSINKNGFSEKKSLVFYNDNWHIGVIGIVAQKLLEIFGKPAFVITNANGVYRGSGRGGDGLDLHDTLSSLSPLLLRYGGHKYACGISLSRENLDAFKEAFEKNINYIEGTRQKTLHADARANFNELTIDFMEFAELLSPFGVGNRQPFLLLRPSSIEPVKNGRIKIIDDNKRTWYGYNQSRVTVPKSEKVSVIVSPVLREEMGERFVHFNLKGFVEE
ncbi:MAG TPA: single-stranded-DNA-specific exonuclease RecJ [Syntrophorhabdaceae bacterium]|nr:single-stranded-DNA-specific exonuclease RecJ [Syntrophorhabdaceae bacterium]HOS04658.1 single-stranded-DNA-specific exonuclease RecJ [Syntrophorhabdaceae bacterium]HPL39993.1 single-stranded-DNA-specific exonuclease RecJ [Syntrophorhabdaceae bacterium]